MIILSIIFWGIVYIVLGGNDDDHHDDWTWRMWI